MVQRRCSQPHLLPRCFGFRDRSRIFHRGCRMRPFALPRHGERIRRCSLPEIQRGAEGLHQFRQPVDNHLCDLPDNREGSGFMSENSTLPSFTTTPETRSVPRRTKMRHASSRHGMRYATRSSASAFSLQPTGATAHIRRQGESTPPALSSAFLTGM